MVQMQGVPMPVSSEVAVEPGSVVVTTTLDYTDQENAIGAGVALTPIVESSATMESFLRNGGVFVNVTEAPSVAVRRTGVDTEPIYSYGLDPPPSTPSRATWPIFVAVAGAGLFLIALGIIVVVYRQRPGCRCGARHSEGEEKHIARGQLAPSPNSAAMRV